MLEIFDYNKLALNHLRVHLNTPLKFPCYHKRHKHKDTVEQVVNHGRQHQGIHIGAQNTSCARHNQESHEFSHQPKDFNDCKYVAEEHY